MAQRRHNFISGAAVLAFAVAVTKVLGALYKIPLGNLLDKEGMAHFYAAYNIYSLLLVLSTAGLPLALSRMVSRAAAQGRLNAHAPLFLHLGLALLAALGLVCSAVMCLLPEALAAALHDSRRPRPCGAGAGGAAGMPVGRTRGYSQGLGDMVPTAAGQVAESAGKLLIGLGLCLYLLRQGAGTGPVRRRGHRRCHRRGGLRPAGVLPRPAAARPAALPEVGTCPRHAAAYCGSCCGPAYPSPWARRA